MAVAPSHAAATQPPNYELRVRLDQGMQFVLEWSSQQVVSIGFPSVGVQTFTKSSSARLRTSVVDRAVDGTTQQRVRLERLAESMSMSGEEVYSLDTDSEGVATDGTGLDTLVGVELTVEVSPRNEIVSVQGLDELRSRILARLDEGAREVTSTILESTLSQESMRGTLAFPAHAVELGDTWSSASVEVNPMVGPLRTRTDYTLRGDAGGILDVETTTEIELAAGEDPSLLNEMIGQALGEREGVGFEIGLDFAGGSGASFIEPRTGLVVFLLASSTLVMSLDVTLPMGDGRALSLSVPMTLLTVETQTISPPGPPG